MKSTFVLTLILGCLVSSPPAYATLVFSDDDAVVGNGNAPVDGYNLTLDTDTGLAWLDLNLSTNYSFDDISPAELQPGGLFAGFRYATQSEMSAFWTHAGLASNSNHHTLDDAAISALAFHWQGYEYNPATNPDEYWASGIYPGPSYTPGGNLTVANMHGHAVSDGAVDFAELADSMALPTESFDHIGHALVRVAAVPEPGPIAAWVGLSVLSLTVAYIRRRWMVTREQSLTVAAPN